MSGKELPEIAEQFPNLEKAIDYFAELRGKYEYDILRIIHRRGGNILDFG